MQSSSQNQFEKQMIEKEKELKRFYALEMDNSIEKEKSNFQFRLESIKAQLKAEYEKILKEKACEIETLIQNIFNEQLEAYKLESKKNLLVSFFFFKYAQVYYRMILIDLYKALSNSEFISVKAFSVYL